MVDVSNKNPTRREAEASAFVALKPAVLKALPKNPKGDPLEVARLAGIMAAKRTSGLIPMCHPLPLSHVDVNFRLCENGVAVTSKVTTTAGGRGGKGGAGGGRGCAPPPCDMWKALG